MARINKQVIKDYFGSFFKQYSPLKREQFDKIRSLVDEAQCGCCNVVSIYWVSEAGEEISSATSQVVFKDADDNILVSTLPSGNTPQVLCVPNTAVTLCLNLLTGALPAEGSITVTDIIGGSVTNGTEDTEECVAITAVSPVYYLTFTAV